MNLGTGTEQVERPQRRSLKLPEGTATVAGQVVSRLTSSTLPQRDREKKLPKLVPESPPEDAEPNAAGLRDTIGRERRRAGALAQERRPRTSTRFWLLNKWQGQVLSV